MSGLHTVVSHNRRRIVADLWAIQAGPSDRVGGIFLRALVPGKARAMVADDPGHLAGMVPPPKWPLSRRSSRHSYSEGYRELR